MKLTDTFLYHLLCKILQLPEWWMGGFHKRNPRIWVFGAWYGNSYSDNSKTMFEYVTENMPYIDAVWVTGNNAVYKDLLCEHKKVVLKGTKEAKKICGEAGYVFISNGASDVEQNYINGARQIWLWHGMPLKTINYDNKLNDNLKAKINFLFPYNKPYRFISVGDKWAPVFKSAFHISEKQIIVTGLPRNDNFYNKEKELLIVETKKKYNNPLIILYMPTFRDKEEKKGQSTSMFNRFGFDVDTFEEFLEKNNLFFFYKGHFFDLQNRKEEQEKSKRFVAVNDTMYSDLYSFIKDVDLLITDYSSVYFDFLLLRKPVVLAPFDKSEYCGEREFYFDYDDIMEGVKAHNWQEVISIIEKKMYYVPKSSATCALNKYKDGFSSQRVADFVVDDMRTF